MVRNREMRENSCFPVFWRELFTNPTVLWYDKIYAVVAAQSIVGNIAICLYKMIGIWKWEVRGMKREDYLSWDQYFMGIALLSAERSKDPNTRVGACIVGANNKILSVGYNGMPSGCDDDRMPWGRVGKPLENKYFFVCHAELNAILNYSGDSLEGATCYSTLFPCNECAKAIIQSGIREIVYLSDKYSDTEATIASKMMFDMVGVTYRAFEAKGQTIGLEL